MSDSTVVEEAGGRLETPVLRIVSGSPTPEELAVVTALFAASGSGGTAPSAKPVRGRWHDPARSHRGRWLTGPGAWRASAR